MLDHGEAPVKGNTDNGLAPGREGGISPSGPHERRGRDGSRRHENTSKGLGNGNGRRLLFTKIVSTYLLYQQGWWALLRESRRALAGDADRGPATAVLNPAASYFPTA